METSTCVMSSIVTFWRNVNPNHLHIMVSFIGGMTCLLPLYFQPISYMEDSSLRRSLSSQQNRDSSVASIALFILLLMDIATETINEIWKNGNNDRCKSEVKEVLLTNAERIVFITGAAILPLISFLPSNTANWAYIYLCGTKCQLVLIAGAVASSLCRSERNCYSVQTINWFLLLLFLGSFGACLFDNMRLKDENTQLMWVLSYLAYSCLMGTIVIFYISGIKFLHSAIPKLIKRYRYSNQALRKKLTADDQAELRLFFPCVYVATSIFAGGLLLLMSIMFFGIQDYNPNALFAHNLAFVMYLVLITYLTMRMMKSEIVQGLYALIESKKMYVRYISHELRTPLNSACLGLQLLGEGLMPGSESSNEDRAEIVQDVKSACRTAVEILDDLLCFDKLESGILEVHKHDVPVIPFICECVEMFTSQAKEAGVTMSMVPPTAALHGATMMPMLSTDTVVMDKFKMDQVLRNLISNALKFTPKGGSVSVSASFVPSAAPVYVRRFSQPQAPHCLTPLKKPSSFFSPMMNSFSVKRKPKVNPGEDIEQGIPNFEKLGYPTTMIPLDKYTYSSRINSIYRNSTKSRKYPSPPCAETVTNGKLVIVVTDTGAGISEMNIRRLFNEIVQFTPEKLQAGGGSGLGLWITNSLVNLHNGSVRAHSAGEGKGSSFTVSIDMQRKSIPEHHILPEVITVPAFSKDTESETLDRVSECKEQYFSHRQNGEWSNKTAVVCIEESHMEYILSEAGSRTSGIESRTSESHQVQLHNTFNSHSRYESGSHESVSFSYQSASDSRHASYRNGSNSYRSRADYSTGQPTSRRLGLSDPEKTAKVTPVVSAQASPVWKRVEMPLTVMETNLVSKHFLVVDDSSLNRKMLCRILRTAGHTCDEADDGLAAVERVKAKMSSAEGEKKVYDALLMDFVMPNMDGPTATKIIRELGYLGPIFGVTGNALDSDVTHFLNHGADDVLTKPFDFNKFQQLMKDIESERGSQSDKVVRGA